MEYKRRRVSSALDDDINLVANTVYDSNDIIEKSSYQITTLQYYKILFGEFIKLICPCFNNSVEDQDG
jgi:hypothetical protein